MCWVSEVREVLCCPVLRCVYVVVVVVVELRLLRWSMGVGYPHTPLERPTPISKTTPKSYICTNTASAPCRVVLSV